MISAFGVVPDRDAVAAMAPRRSVVQAEAWSDQDSPLPVTSEDPVWGRRDAPVTIVVYGDVSSRFSSDSEPDLGRIKDVYGKDKIRVVWKTFLAHPDSKARLAAEAAEGVFALAGSAAFWDFQGTIGGSQDLLDVDHLSQLAQEVGVENASAFKAGLEGHRWAEKVDRDLAESRGLGWKVAPSFAVNGVLMDGPQPFVNFKAIVDRELARAREKISSGTPASRVYVEITKERARDAELEAGSERDDGQDTETVFAVPVGHGPVLGTPEAVVTVVEFGDFRSRFCARAEATLRALREKYRGKLRLVWRNARSSPDAVAIAEAVAEARAERGDEGFWAMHDKVLVRQHDLVKDGRVNFDAIADAARESGIDPDRVLRAMRAHTYEKDILADAAVAESFRAKGTPHFFINGRGLVGAQKQVRFENIIDEEVAKGGALLAKGVKPSELYDALTRAGRGADPSPDSQQQRGTSAFDYARHTWLR